MGSVKTLDFDCSAIDELGKFRLENTGRGKDLSPNSGSGTSHRK